MSADGKASSTKNQANLDRSNGEAVMAAKASGDASNAVSSSKSAEAAATSTVASPSGASALGTADSPLPSRSRDEAATEGSSGKKVPKTAAPSKVLHFRHLPAEATEVQVAALGAPFGKVVHVMLLRQRNQAFLEMQEVKQAEEIVKYYNFMAASINQTSVYIQFSHHNELQVASSSSGTSSISPGSKSPCTSPTPSTDGSRVLLVSVDNMLYVVTLDTLYSIFSKYGTVQKIIIFQKNGRFQSFVEYSDASACATAKKLLNFQNIYDRCCTISTEYSRLSSLNVRFNNDRQRDYTLHPAGPANGAGGVPAVAAAAAAAAATPASGLLGQAPGIGPDGTMVHNAVGAMAFPGQPAGILGHAPMPPPDMPPHLAAAMAAGAMPFPHPSHPTHNGLLGQAPMMPHEMHHDGGPPFMPPMMNMGPSDMSAWGGMPWAQGPPSMKMTSVLHVGNLDQEHVTPYKLFILFGVYGDVLRVKILYNHKDIALIQMASPAQAQCAMRFLDKVSLFGKELGISFSRHNTVIMPRGEPHASELTVDYTMSVLHRFRNPTQSYNNIFPVSTCLFVSNIPEDLSDQYMKDLLSTASGENVVNLRWIIRRQNLKHPDRRTCVVEFPTIEAAVVALIETHNKQLREKIYLRVAFARSALLAEASQGS